MNSDPQVKGDFTAFASRFNELCDDKEIPPKGQARQTVVAGIFHVSQKGARKWLEGEGLPKLERCLEIAQWGNCYVEWLLTGRGPKRDKDLALDPFAAKIIVAMQSVPGYLKATAVQQVEALSQAGKPPAKEP